MSDMSTLGSLALVYGQLSLLAFGGANSILPEMQRQVVDVHHWLTAQEFAALFALAQAAPGPNMMVVSLIGWRVAGLAGALTTTLAVAGPSSILALFVTRVWDRFRHRPWRAAIQSGLVPVTAGLLMASAFLLLASTVTDWRSLLLVAVCVPLFLWGRLHPILVLGAAALCGALGLVG
jgi:chromate transporter